MRATSYWWIALGALVVAGCSDSSGGAVSTTAATSAATTTTTAATVVSTTAVPTTAAPAPADPRPDVASAKNPHSLAMAFDATAGVIVAVESGDTWLFDVTKDRWTQQTAKAPHPDYGRWMFYSAVLGGAVLFDTDNEFWRYDLTADEWTAYQETGPKPPLMTGGLAVAIDPVSGDLLRVQISANAYVWRFSFTTARWTEVVQRGGPVAGPAGGPLMWYDPVAVGFVLLQYGAGGGAGDVDPVWKFDMASSTWTKLASLGRMNLGWSPEGTEATFASSVGRSIIFSGGVTAEYDAARNTWALYANGAPTTQALDMSAAPRIAGARVVYDPTRRRVLAFGGETYVDPVWRTLDAMWSYDLGSHAWTELMKPTN